MAPAAGGQCRSCSSTSSAGRAGTDSVGINVDIDALNAGLVASRKGEVARRAAPRSARRVTAASSTSSRGASDGPAGEDARHRGRAQGRAGWRAAHAHVRSCTASATSTRAYSGRLRRRELRRTEGDFVQADGLPAGRRATRQSCRRRPPCVASSPCSPSGVLVDVSLNEVELRSGSSGSVLGVYMSVRLPPRWP